MSAEHRIVVLGSGFAGSCAARALGRRRIPGAHITVLNAMDYMQYYPALYRLATGGSRKEICIPLSWMYQGTDVETIVDTVVSVDTTQKSVQTKGGKSFGYDTLLLAPGSEPATFGIPGIEEHAFSVHTVEECMHFKRHIHDVILAAKDDPSAGTIVVVGGGPTGIETAGAVLAYARKVARQARIDPAVVKVSLVEALPRLLAALPERVSVRVLRRMQRLGINVLLNKAVAEVKPDMLLLKDGQIVTKTVVWTAGVKPHTFLKTVPGLTLDKRGRVTVDEHLEAMGCPGVYALGDAASTQYAGLAQTAVEDGRFIGRFLAVKLQGKTLPAYHPHAPAYALPAGPAYAAVKMGPVTVYGFAGWFLRRAADFIAFWDVLPLRNAIRMFFGYYDRRQVP